MSRKKQNGIKIRRFTDEGSVVRYNSVDLDEMIKDGYEFKVLNGIYWNESKNVFKEFVNELYEHKSKAKKEGKGALAFVVKILLNSFYGKFGQRRFFDNVGILNNELTKIGEKTETRNPRTSVHVASFITSYSRRELNWQMEKVLKAGHQVYYCDTDSIMCDYEALTEELFPVGDNMLEWSVENHEGNPIKEGYFLQKKVYCINEPSDKDKQFKVKIKGFGKDAFSFEELKRASLTGDYSKLVSTQKRFVKFGVHNSQNKPYCTWYVQPKRVLPQRNDALITLKGGGNV